jgi:hypothetical protein
MVLVEGDVRQGRQAPVDHILMPVSTQLCSLLRDHWRRTRRRFPSELSYDERGCQLIDRRSDG